MKTFGSDKIKDEAIFLARFLLVLLFLIFGWGKLTNYSGTVAYMQQVGAPMPPIATLIAIFMEFFVSLAIIVGIFTRPLAVLLAVYTLGTALIGHHYWSMTGMANFEGEINFYKNISIIGGCFLLYVTGAGKYSLDAKLGL
ncbi:DoxX family protein [Acidithiobacillus sulfuriphilus]|uniref:DoxX family protein n=1 Tax=Acidithiobacillus sulfuriphilus TaxID=1867749 RepID=UPI003F62C054